MFISIRKRINKNRLVKSILILAGGSGIAQIFPFVASIFISRLYSPADIGIYALYFSTCTILGTVLCLGYENTIYISKGEDLANNATVLCILISFLLSGLLSLLLLYASGGLWDLIGISVIEKYFPYLFISLFSSSLSSILSIRINRTGSFKFLAKMKILTSFSSSCIQVILGFLQMGSKGLIIANILSYILVDVILCWFWIHSEILIFSKIRKRAIFYIFRRFRNFSVFMTPAGVISSISGELPNFLMMKFFGDSILGYYSFGQKLIVYPINFIVSSIQNVFQKESTEEFHGTGKSKKVYLQTLKLMLPYAIAFIFGFLLFSPLVFKLLFGVKWEMSATFVQILSAFIIVRSMSSILSFPIILVERQKANLLFLIGLLIISVGSFYLGYFIFNTPVGVLGSFSLFGVIFYLLYMRYSFYCANRLSFN